MTFRSVRVRIATCAIVVSTIAASRSAHAYRPFDGTDADVADYGEYELEFGTFGVYREGDRRDIVAPWIIHNYGFTPGWEIVLEGRQSYVFRGPDAPKWTLLEPQLLLKTILREGSLQGGEGISVASEFGAYFPEVHTPSNKWGGQVGVIMSYAWPDFVVHLNVVDYLSRLGHFGLFTSVIFEGPQRWTVRPVAELLADRDYASTTFRNGLERSVLGGAIWRVTEGFTIDAALRVGAVEDRSMQELRIGFTWGVEVFSKERAPIAD